MVDTLFIIPLQRFIYSVCRMAAVASWSGARALILSGYVVMSSTDFYTDFLFGPAISEVALISNAVIPMFATIAVLLLAFSYMLSPIVKIRVVVWQKALGWLLLATLFFNSAPGMYVEGEQMRRALADDFYQIILQQSPESGPPPLAAVQTGANDVPLNPLQNYFGSYVAGDQYIDGLDMALAFTHASAQDVLTAPTDLPDGFVEAYFPPESGPVFWLSMTDEERNEVITLAILGIIRLWLSYAIATFGILEQLIYFCLAISAGLLFISLLITLPFALFERTELMARSVLDMILELFIFSTIAATLQAVTVGMVLSGAQTLNPTLTLGAAFIGGVIEVLVLFRALGTIWDAMNRMFVAMSQVVGGKVLSPGEAAAAGAKAAAGVATAAVTAGAGLAVAGAGALTTAAAGGSGAQVAGAALAGSNRLFNVAALGQMTLPDGALKDKLQGFYEGAIAQRVMPVAGGLVLPRLQQRAGDAAAPPTSGRPSAAQASSSTPTTGAQQDIRLDAADTTQMRDAIATAVASAIRSAPQGGYQNPNDILTAIRAAMGGMANSPGVGGYLLQNQQAIVTYVNANTGLGLTSQKRQTTAIPDADAVGGAHTPPPSTPPPTRTPSPTRAQPASKAPRQPRVGATEGKGD